MSFGRQRKRRPAVEITSLIDVVFILLIFFMVTTTFADKKALEIDLPDAKKGKTMEQTLDVVEVDNTGTISYQGERVTLQQLQEQVSDKVAEEGVEFMNLRVDTGTPYGTVIQVQETLQEAGLKGFYSQVDEAASE